MKFKAHLDLAERALSNQLIKINGDQGTHS